MTTKKKGIDQSIIRDLAAILNETNLTEIEVEQDDLRIRVSRATSAPQQFIAASAPLPTAPIGMASEGVPTSVAAVPLANGHEVPSPMVGTAYLSPSPDSEPFIQVGQSIKEGETLLIIEAMKTMNQIPSTRTGKIIEIRVEDGQPVEFGDTLVIIE